MPRPDVRSASLQRARFVSFDGAVAVSTWQQRPDRYRHVERDFGAVPRIARGGGYSYAAASFGERVIVQEMGAFDRVLAFDGTTVRVEAGITANGLLAWARRHRLYFPVLPGYPLVTVGGCIAADVHGKNAVRDGTFSDWVERLTLYHPATGFRSIAPDSHPELFEATCGGFGMTGLIVDATLRLAKLPAENVAIERQRVSSLDEALERLSNDDSDFAYSWHDGSAREGQFGRGMVFRGEWTDASPVAGDRPFSPMSAASRGAWRVSLWNRVSVPFANRCFRWLGNRSTREVKSLFDAAFPFAHQTLYHRMFGKGGLAELQIVVPWNAARDFSASLAKLVNRLDPPLVMFSAKPFSGSQRSLSPAGKGVLIALDLFRTAGTAAFITEFDALTIDVGAQPNVAKDSRLPQTVASRTLPSYDMFRQRIRRIDPDRLYQSELSRRLAI